MAKDKSDSWQNWRLSVEEYISQHPMQIVTWEATRRCNLACLHCGSPSGEMKNCCSELTTKEVKAIFDEIARDFPHKNIDHINITGGEPFVRGDLLNILDHISRQDCFKNIAIQTNGIIIAEKPDILKKIKKFGVSGLGISIDGLEKTHNNFRQTKDGFQKAVKAAQIAVENGFVTTVSMVANAKNFHEIPELFSFVKKKIKPRYFRLMTLDCLGRTELLKDYLLTCQQIRWVIDWLKMVYQKECSSYNDPSSTMVELGCGGFLGRELEGMFRPFIFHCNAGIVNLGILHDGKIAACSNIPRYDEFIEGDWRKVKSIKTIWETRYKKYRSFDWKKNGVCKSCQEWDFCHGGPMHKRKSNGSMVECLYRRYYYGE